MAGIGRHNLEARWCWRIKQTIWVCLREYPKIQWIIITNHIFSHFASWRYTLTPSDKAQNTFRLGQALLPSPSAEASFCDPTESCRVKSVWQSGNGKPFLFISIYIYLYININQYFISFYMPIYRIFPILLDYQRLRPVDVDQAPREAHQLSVERLEHLEGSGRPSG